ncbi:transposase [Nitrosomonas aestuarii]|uniref:transposase n=1 Tax=Nitrosomonas aestuarii TaxID=52441 RepID=UPI001C625CB3
MTVGNNPERLKSEADFAALCGVKSIPASPSKVNRNRLNRDGDRAASSALHIIAIERPKTDVRTKE